MAMCVVAMRDGRRATQASPLREGQGGEGDGGVFEGFFPAADGGAAADEIRKQGIFIVVVEGDDLGDAALGVEAELDQAGFVEVGGDAQEAAGDQASLAPGGHGQIEDFAAEAADLVVGFVGAGHVASGEGAGDGGAVPAVQLAMFGKEGIEDGGAVTGGVDVGDVGAGVFVGEDGFFDEDGSAAEDFFIDSDADGGGDEIALEGFVGREDDVLDAAVALEALGTAIDQDADALLFAGFGPQTAGGRVGELAPEVAGGGDEGDFQSELGEGGGEFDAGQPAPADDGRGRARGGGGARGAPHAGGGGGGGGATARPPPPAAAALAPPGGGGGPPPPGVRGQ